MHKSRGLVATAVLLAVQMGAAAGAAADAAVTGAANDAVAGTTGVAAPHVATPGVATPHAALESLARDITYTSAREFPLQATYLGIAGHDGELEKPSEQSRADYVAQLERWDGRLKAVAAEFSATTALVDRDDAKLIGAQLAAARDALLVYETDRKDYGAAANAIVGVIFTQFQHLPAVASRAQQRAWADITSRLAHAPRYIAASQQLVTKPCHRFGLTATERLEGAPGFLRGPLTDTARTQLGARSRAFQAFVAARDAALVTLLQTKAYIDAHVNGWPDNFAMGRAAYERMLHEELLMPFDAADVERMGRDELAHGWAEEAWLAALSRQRSLAFGAASGGGMAPDGAALIDYYRDRIAELRAFVVSNDVVTVPEWLGSMQVMATPDFLQPIFPGAWMDAPRLFDQNTTGFYFITPPKSLAEAAARLDVNEDFDHDRILSTAAHEALPGHFMQLSIAKRHPNFVRKIQDSSEFAEGWAFYGEEMLVRLGMYNDHLDGRLHTARWERVRGARAILDAKLQTGEWSFDQAAEFLATESSFSKQAAEAAVSGFIANPTQAITYTVGRLQIENLLGEYLRKSGVHGSLHDFHDRLLSYGTTPLSIVGPELIADLDQPAARVRAAANY